ncbi:MAG: SlyX family protein [Xanthomonadaceae bacterium]|jgi:SlyX protein|nr:SlyX family protein [Xanthomonadaceae bacterium]
MPAPEREPQATDRRFAELETRLAFQEQALQELSDALAEARREGQRDRERLGRVLEDLKQLRRALAADPAGEPPPPHY